MACLSISIFFVVTFAIMKEVYSSCSFPDGLKMARSDPPWYSHVRSDRTRDIEYYIRHSIMEIVIANDKQKRVRWICHLTIHDSFLLRRVDLHVKSYYKCVKFIFRSKSVVQLMWSHELNKFDHNLCNTEFLKLDPWPLIRYETLEMDYTPCPIHGGYNMKITDSQLGDNGCNFMLRPMRLEAECMAGDGVTFDFGRRNCLPDVNMFVTQRTMCVTNWRDHINHYVILRRNEDKDLWCLVIPLERGNDVTAYLYSDLICQYDKVNEIRIPKELKFFTLQLHLRIFSSLCEDEYSECSNISCNNYIQNECQKSCALCDLKVIIKRCSFPRRFNGSWSLTDLDGYKNIDLIGSRLTVEGVGSFKCASFPDSPSRKTKTFSAISLYENGCRPRYTCIKLRRLGPSVLKYSLSHSYVWPSLERDFGTSICDQKRFQADPSPINDLYRSHAGSGKPIVSKFPRPKPVTCNLTSVLTLSATLPEGYICSGRMYQHCDDVTKVRLEFKSCGGLIQAYRDYSCLANYEGHYWERILLMQNLQDQKDVICFIFSQFYPNEAYSMVASQCDQRSFNFVRSGLRKPLLKMKFRSEQEYCVSIPQTTSECVLSKPDNTLDLGISMSDSSNYSSQTIRFEELTTGPSVNSISSKERVKQTEAYQKLGKNHLENGSTFVVNTTSNIEIQLQKQLDSLNNSAVHNHDYTTVFAETYLILLLMAYIAL